MFDLDQLRRDHPDLGPLADEVERLRAYIIYEAHEADLHPDVAADLLGIEPHVVRALTGWVAVTKSHRVAAPVPKSARGRGRPPRFGPTGQAECVLATAVELAGDSATCPDLSAIAQRSGVPRKNLGPVISRLRKSGRWPFPYQRKKLAKPHATNGKVAH